MADVNSVLPYGLEDGYPHLHPGGYAVYLYHDISELPEWLAERVAVAGLNEPMTWVGGVLWYLRPEGRRYRVILTPEDSVRWKKERAR